jgi:hypothetical protein
MFIHYTAQNLLFAELLHKIVYISDAPYFLFPSFCFVIFWLISGKIFKKPQSFIPPVIFILSPWMWYLSSAHSFYIFFFFLTLTIVYGIILIRSARIITGNLFIILASTMTVYSSSLFLIFIPLTFIILVISKILSFRSLKISIVSLVILISPLLFIINKNQTEFKNNFINEVKIFSDPSLLNSINRFQGAAARIGLKNLSRISENKYLFFGEYVSLKYITQLVPKTFFTPEYKLSGFSFNPPVFMGFVIPFVYGLYLALKKPDLRKIIFISSLLTVPSILANEQVALNRLILFSPIVFLLISYGLINLYRKRGETTARSFLMLTLFLVMFQLIVVINDIRHKERQRVVQYFGNKYEITEP